MNTLGKSVLLLVLLCFSNCTVSVSELSKILFLRLQNDSGVMVKEVKILFITSDNIEVDLPIIISNVPSTQTKEVRYNLEHITGFQNITCKASVLLENLRDKPMEARLITVDSRNVNLGVLLIIKSDTLVRQAIRKF
jgi:hypothetical protein